MRFQVSGVCKCVFGSAVDSHGRENMDVPLGGSGVMSFNFEFLKAPCKILEPLN